MLEALKQNGVPVSYVRAKDEGYGIDKKANHDYKNASIVWFLKKYLVGGVKFNNLVFCSAPYPIELLNNLFLIYGKDVLEPLIKSYLESLRYDTYNIRFLF